MKISKKVGMVWALVGVLWAGISVQAEEPQSPPWVKFGGFVDAYYAFDFLQPTSFDRSFTTQPARHNEFNLNLAYIDAVVDQEKIHGRVALQAGTSVQSNYASEAKNGTVSGPSLSQHIQEAYAGFKLHKNLWIDGGIFFSHIGAESFISKENWTYSRSLMSDYTPYYQTGVRITYVQSEKLSGQLHLLNGWQNISETNPDKAIGLQLEAKPHPKFSFTYNGFVGQEGELRLFSDFIFKFMLHEKFHFIVVGDVGNQRKAGSTAFSTWGQGTLLVHSQFHPKVAVSGRLEYYADPDQVIVTTGTTNGFQVFGASTNLDVRPYERILWRLEVRGFFSRDSIYPGRAGFSAQDGFVATSIGLII